MSSYIHVRSEICRLRNVRPILAYVVGRCSKCSSVDPILTRCAATLTHSFILSRCTLPCLLLYQSLKTLFLKHSFTIAQISNCDSIFLFFCSSNTIHAATITRHWRLQSESNGLS